MAGAIYNTGTTSSATTFISSGCTITIASSKDFTIYNGGIDQIYFKKAAKTKPKPITPTLKKGFWDGVEWKEYTSYIPRKSITGKVIIGKMHRRARNVLKIGGSRHTQYAKTKELFASRLKGDA